MDHNNLIAQVGHNYEITNPANPASTLDPVTATENYISLAITFLSVVAFIFFAVQVILAGYSFMTSKGDPKNMEVARNKLTQNILGLTIVVIATGVTALIASMLGIENIFSLNSFFTSVGL